MGFIFFIWFLYIFFNNRYYIYIWNSIGWKPSSSAVYTCYILYTDIRKSYALHVPVPHTQPRKNIKTYVYNIQHRVCKITCVWLMWKAFRVMCIPAYRRIYLDKNSMVMGGRVRTNKRVFELFVIECRLKKNIFWNISRGVWIAPSKLSPCR